MVEIARNSSFVKGARFRKPIFRPTAMSIAMCEAGIIPGLHMVEERNHRHAGGIQR